ncbi:TIGR03915 family putative DNA repair protein [Asticcacaulis sp. AND118]|uniref:TIGR03915 family putative DNA repair protein n=1 Tax=Asticcacaulis sp. AND118 TaxID=2840468 RepID=UPI001CFFC931|nr:TIGR03915 family putative DNA repair protein [Asticcacaulis sp. AND118]UDF03370.1 TIGR03915 family putative DNA repair protein [Asticcacaulis sp. AND118]
MRFELRGRGDFAEWRNAAREALRAGVSPREVEWGGQGRETGLFDEAPSPLRGEGRGEGVKHGVSNFPSHPALRSTLSPQAGREKITVNSSFIELSKSVICHCDPRRFDLCYRLLWRLQRDKHLLDVVTDPDVALARAFAKSVGRDTHKMKAFVRFREVPAKGPRRAFVAWFEPEHFIVARAAGFFQRRFNDMDWLIATPKGSAAWDGKDLRLSDEPAHKPDITDETDDLWRIYFAHIFNPARLKVQAMQSEMPKKYWKNLPEAELIPDLIRNAEQRVRDMAERGASDTAPKFHERLQEKLQGRAAHRT